MKQVFRIISIIFMVMGFLQLISLSVVCGLDNTKFTGQNHFVGFMFVQGLWGFFYGAIIIIVLGIALLFLSLFLVKKIK